MKKLFVVTAFAAFAFAAHSAAACDWNREASAKDQVVATTDQRQASLPKRLVRPLTNRRRLS